MLARDEARVLAPPRRDLALEAGITGAAFLADGTLAAALGDGSVRFVPATESRSETTAQPHSEDSAVLTMAVDLDGAGVVTGGDDGRVMRTGSGGETSLLAEFPGRQVDVLAVSAVAGLRAAAAGREVRLVDRTGNTVAATDDHPSTVTGLAFNPKGKRLAVAHYGGVNLRWISKLDQGPLRLPWRGSHIGVTWSPDGTVVISAMQECELHGWRLTDGQHFAMAGYAAKARSLDWLARPMTLVTSGGDCVTAWSFTGKGPMGKPPIEVGRGLGRLVTRVAVHPKSRIVAAGFDEGQVIVCALGGEDQVVRLRWPDRQSVTALAWSRDGKRLAAGTNGGGISIYDLSQGLPA